MYSSPIHVKISGGDFEKYLKTKLDTDGNGSISATEITGFGRAENDDNGVTGLSAGEAIALTRNGEIKISDLADALQSLDDVINNNPEGNFNTDTEDLSSHLTRIQKTNERERQAVVINNAHNHLGIAPLAHDGNYKAVSNNNDISGAGSNSAVTGVPGHTIYIPFEASSDGELQGNLIVGHHQQRTRETPDEYSPVVTVGTGATMPLDEKGNIRGQVAVVQDFPLQDSGEMRTRGSVAAQANIANAAVVNAGAAVDVSTNALIGHDVDPAKAPEVVTYTAGVNVPVVNKETKDGGNIYVDLGMQTSVNWRSRSNTPEGYIAGFHNQIVNPNIRFQRMVPVKGGELTFGAQVGYGLWNGGETYTTSVGSNLKATNPQYLNGGVHVIYKPDSE